MESDYENKGCSIASILQKLDIFGMNIALAFNKKDEFKTSIGGLFSIVHYSIMTMIFFTLISRTINRTNIEVYENIASREQTYNQELAFPFENDKFMIGLFPSFNIANTT